MKQEPTPTIEDYLGVIYTLERDSKQVIAARLAELLEVSAPTVTVTLRRMLRDEWITFDDHKRIHLTERGTMAAKSVIRKHMLTEWMLSRILKVPWSQIHFEADKIEHTISNDIEKRLLSAFEDPSSCPHGNPMPDQESISVSWKCLNDFKQDDQIIIRRIHERLEDNLEVMRFLEKNQVLPGNHAVVKAKLDFNKTIEIRIANQFTTIGFKVAALIFAELK